MTQGNLMQNINTAYKALGFRHLPFSITPDRSFFYPSARYVAALQHLRFGIASGGFTMLTGEVGLGKTLLCRQVLSVEPPDTRIAYVLNPPQTTWSFCEEFMQTSVVVHREKRARISCKPTWRRCCSNWLQKASGSLCW